MRFLLATALFFSLGHATHATPFSATKPVAPIKAAIPRHAQIWLSGTVPGPPRTSIVFYQTVSSGVPSETFKLDVWQKQGKASPRHVQTVVLENRLFSDLFLEDQLKETKVKASLHWLRRSTRQSPVLELEIKLGDFASINHDVRSAHLVLVFPGGFKNKPSVQRFDSNETMESGTTIDLSKTDPKGLLVVKSQTWDSNDPGGTRSIQSTFNWNGQEFAVPDSKSSPALP